MYSMHARYARKMMMSSRDLVMMLVKSRWRNAQRTHPWGLALVGP